MRLRRPPAPQGIHKAVLREFLNPRHWAPSANREFFFNYDQARTAAAAAGLLLCFWLHSLWQVCLPPQCSAACLWFGAC